MITHITTRYFKRFETQTFPLEPLTLLAGPNNSGKSTLLQAAMVWNLAMQKRWETNGPRSTSKAMDQTRVPIMLQGFSALPLPSMVQLLSPPKKLYAARLAMFDLVGKAGRTDIRTIPDSKQLEVLREKFDGVHDIRLSVRSTVRDKLKILDTARIFEGRI